ncbi:nuclear transcription factor Y subunit B-1-like [Vigna unguiculata]|uniref:Nuclear transcription factor Y n=1 Tax=Vigna unguiculata TaxID=3917 RepID=A0A4D6L8E9_VIGUN|nr:nuclear transcription factor Y subunit B-1-like [Vigna unguiculata]QCD84750.1 nuclear transcription factor Y [Vigna unguiculata]
MTGKRNQTTTSLTTATTTSPVGSPTSGNISDSSSKEQDRFLPIANVSRIMKRALPANAKISKEAKETVQECVSEFISFITGEASDKCQREKRKTINGDDLLWAMTTLGFENYVGPLKLYLNNYRETEGEKSSMAKQDQEHSPTHQTNDGSAATKPDFNSFGAAFYSVGPQVTPPKSFTDIGGINGYRDTSINSVIAQSAVSGDQDSTGNRMMPPNLRYRVEW